MFGRRFRFTLALLLTAACLSGGLFSSRAQAGFYKVIRPPVGTGGEKEVDPPVQPPPPIDPPSTQSPEPGTMVLAIIGGGALAAWRRKRKSAA